ncbi:hypothetical protein HMPREF9720_0134 [Alistipes sp. HGB5]|nr:hypothetical protein HMPREF9720_0134 [Alistipes sp. HGB5]
MQIYAKYGLNRINIVSKSPENRQKSYFCGCKTGPDAPICGAGSVKMPVQECLARICTISSWIRTADSPAFSNFVSENPKPV